MKKLLLSALLLLGLSSAFGQGAIWTERPRGGAITGATLDPTDVYTTEDNITAFGGGGQANATQLSCTASIHRITTVTTSADSVKLCAAVPGAMHIIINNGNGNGASVFGQTGETMNAQAANTSVTVQRGVTVFYAPVAGAWYTRNDNTVNGTTSQITATRNTANTLTLSTPQNLDTAAQIQFNSVGLGVVASATAGVITGPASTGVQHAGTATNDAASAGQVGEVLTTTVASGSAVSLSTGTSANIATLSLTAGDWDCNGQVVHNAAATTSITLLQIGISASSATLPTQAGGSGIGTDPLGIDRRAASVPAGALTTAVGPVRVSLSGTTNIFLVANDTFTVSTMTGYGTIRCRRER